MSGYLAVLINICFELFGIFNVCDPTVLVMSWIPLYK